jgi:hypothetical protein
LFSILIGQDAQSWVMEPVSTSETSVHFYETAQYRRTLPSSFSSLRETEILQTQFLRRYQYIYLEIHSRLLLAVITEIRIRQLQPISHLTNGFFFMPCLIPRRPRKTGRNKKGRGEWWWLYGNGWLTALWIHTSGETEVPSCSVLPVSASLSPLITKCASHERFCTAITCESLHGSNRLTIPFI